MGTWEAGHTEDEEADLKRQRKSKMEDEKEESDTSEDAKKNHWKGSGGQIWILLSTLYEGGGAEVQARMEFHKWQESGTPAYLLTFDPKLQRGESRERHHLNLTSPWTENRKRILENVDSPELIQAAYHAVKAIWNQESTSSHREEAKVPGRSRKEWMPKEGKEGTKEPHRQGHLSRQKNQGMQESAGGEKYWKEQQDQRQRREEREQGEQDILPTLVLHLHNITYAFSSICRALKRIQRDFPGRCIILQTIHDCRIICDKGTRLLPDGSFCKENSFRHCYENCMRGPGKLPGKGKGGVGDALIDPEEAKAYSKEKKVRETPRSAEGKANPGKAHIEQPNTLENDRSTAVAQRGAIICSRCTVSERRECDRKDSAAPATDGRKPRYRGIGHRIVQPPQFCLCSLRQGIQIFQSFLHWRYRLRIRVREERARKQTMDLLVVPSACLADLVRKHGYEDVVHIPNMVDGNPAMWGEGPGHKTEDATRTKSFPPGKKRLLYYCGTIREGKGVFWLLRNYRQQEYRNLELHLIGPLKFEEEKEGNSRKDKAEKQSRGASADQESTNKETANKEKRETAGSKGGRYGNREIQERKRVGHRQTEEHFRRLLAQSGAIYEGVLTREAIMRKLAQRDAFAVIIPSVAFENYPNVGLEAIVCGCLVCGADNGGIPEMAGDRRLLFELGYRENRTCGWTGKMEREDQTNFGECAIIDAIQRAEPNSKTVRECLEYLDAMTEHKYLQLRQIQWKRVTSINGWSTWRGKIEDRIRLAVHDNKIVM